MEASSYNCQDTGSDTSVHNRYDIHTEDDPHH